jgi:signal transduction histidine kinase
VISPDDTSRIFEPFQRLSERTSHEGFGLGLAIVASITAIHNGTVTAVPREGGGLTVSVTIPAAPVGAISVQASPVVWEEDRDAPSQEEAAWREPAKAETFSDGPARVYER